MKRMHFLIRVDPSQGGNSLQIDHKEPIWGEGGVRKYLQNNAFEFRADLQINEQGSWMKIGDKLGQGSLDFSGGGGPIKARL